MEGGIVKAVGISIEESFGSYPKLVVEFALLPAAEQFLAGFGREDIAKMAEIGFNCGLVPRKHKKQEDD